MEIPTCLSSCSLHLHAIIRFINTTGNQHRKGVIRLARHLGLPSTTSGNLHTLSISTIQALSSIPEILYDDDNRSLRLSEHEVHARLEAIFSNPTYAGILIHICCIAPLPPQETTEVKLGSFLKEIKSMSRSGYRPTLCYDSFFGKYEVPLHPHLKPNPPMARVVHHAIDAWKQTFNNRTLYPFLSNKLLPKSTMEHIDAAGYHVLEKTGEYTQATLEWLDYQGIQIEDGCELKQRWYTNGITPRSYFVTGPTCYYPSRYTKDLWNSLCDHLSTSERTNRVNVHRLKLDSPTHHFFVYDLTSFTSNMATQREFLSALAEYCMDTDVKLMSIRDGIIQTKLGILINEYNETTNHHPVYSCPELKILNNRHGVAGFLGVIGNIATCNFLHGAVLLQVAESESGAGCAGDDAAVSTRNDEEVSNCAELIGILAMEKTFSTDIDGSILYLKRRTEVILQQGETYLTQKFFWQPPSLLHFQPRGSLSRFREFSYDQLSLRKLYASSIMASFYSASRLPHHQLSEAKLVMQSYYQHLRFPPEGSVPQIQNAPYFVPALETFGSRDFIVSTIVGLYKGRARVVKRTRERLVDELPMNLREDGVLFRTKWGGPNLKLLVKLGFIQRIEAKREYIYGDEGLDRLIDEYTRSRNVGSLEVVYEVLHRVPPDLFNGLLDLSVTGVIVTPDELENEEDDMADIEEDEMDLE